jgi:hypothetical protein
LLGFNFKWLNFTSTVNVKNVEHIKEMSHEPNTLKFYSGEVASSSLIVLEYLT